MTSLIQDKQHEQQKTYNQIEKHQFSDSKSKLLLNKPYSFFIYYKIYTSNKYNQLQKISLRIRQQYSSTPDKYLQNSKKNQKNVNLFFIDLQNQNELQNSFLQLKYHIVQNKTKIIFIGYQSSLIYLIDKTNQFGIDLQTIPFAIYSSLMNDDLSVFLGWSQQSLGDLSSKTPHQLSIFAKQWISSPSQKIDLWQVLFKVKQTGSISKLIYDKSQHNYHLQKYQNMLQRKQYFMSHFSVGYHSKMFLEYQASKNVQQNNLLKKIKFGFQGFKNFCCVGNKSMKTSTGIVNISFKDQKNREIQIMKQFYDEQCQNLNQTKYKQNNRKILSMVFSNIDYYQGNKLQSSSRMNDNKLQLISFESKNEHKKISSIGGQIKINFQTELQVYIKIADECFVLKAPLQATIRPYKKMKVLINKQSLGC